MHVLILIFDFSPSPTQQPMHDGEACPILEEDKACNIEVCEGKTYLLVENLYMQMCYIVTLGNACLGFDNRLCYNFKNKK